MISSLQRLLCPAVLLAALVLFGARASGTIVGGEFYLGDDPGEGNGTALSLAEGTSLAACFEEATISLAGLDPGTYDVGVRVQDDEDRWSNPIIRRFTYTSRDFELAGGLDPNGPADQETGTPNTDRLDQRWTIALPETLEAREYPLQIGALTLSLEVTDPSARETVLAHLRQVLNSSLYVTSRMEVGAVSGDGITLTFLEPGRHSASWVASEDFVVSLEQSGSIGAAAARIVEAEYFLTVAPLPGEGIPVPIEGDGSDTVESISALVLDITSLKAGTHAVGIRFRNAGGYWGNPVWRRFTSFSLFGDLDLEPPVLTLNGAASLEVGLGSEFADPGASALDAEDGDLSDQVVLRALPDTTLPGEQVIEYAVADRAGNVGTIQRTVVVTAQPVTTVSLTVAGPLANGAVNGNQQTYPLGQQATLTAVADPGYLFTGWTGDASGTGNPLTLVMDGDRTVGATFAQDDGDPDQDGLSNYQELVVHGTDPDNADSDGDGVDDGIELADQTDPNDPNDYNFLNSGLVAYYPFNGNANDESGNGHDGTVNGASLTADRNGDTNSAYNFDGTGYIDCPDGVYFGGDFTVSGWVNLREHSNWGRLIDFANTRDDHVTLTLSFQDSGRPRGDVIGNNNSVLSEEALPLNRWAQVSWTFAQNTTTLYINGQAVAEETWNSPPASVVRTDNWIGRSNWEDVAGDERTNGILDDIRIYDRALSEQEVTDLYDLEKPDLEKGLVAYYPFNGNANDESGNGNDGTVNGATLTTDRNGEAGSAYDFEQDSLITVDFDDFAFGAQGSHTISTWARFSAFNNPAGRLINIGSEPCLEFAQQLDVRPGGPEGRRLTASVGEGCIEFKETSTAAPELDQWYHYTMVYEGGVAKLFVDGQYVTETPQFTKELPAVNILWLGGHRRNQDHLGNIDDVRIYNRALSEEEVSELYELEKSELDPDTDSDGMPDDWERAHGLVVGIDDSELDLDGDKTPNLLEWLAGTDPNDQSSAFRPLGTHDGTNYHLSVPTITGRSYKISISLNLQDWLPYGTLNGDDTSQVWTFVETTVPDGPFHSHQHPYRYFFRVEISILNP